MATLKDVAKKANVNISTVSRALNNSAYVHPDTKAKICAAAKELGYTPNPVAQALRQGKRNTLGMIVPWINAPTISEVVQGFLSEAKKEGYEVLLSVSGNDTAAEAECLNRMRSGIVDAIAIASPGKNKRLVQDIVAGGIPMMQLLHCADKSVSSIGVDAFDGGFQCVRHLYGLGCRRIALLIDRTEVATFSDTYEGYRSAVRKFALPEIVADAENCPITSGEFAFAATGQLMDSTTPPDAIIGTVEIHGRAILQALSMRGEAVADSVKIVCLSGQSAMTRHPFPIIPLEAPNMSIGEKAAKTLISDIATLAEGRELTPMHISFPEWIVPSREPGL